MVQNNRIKIITGGFGSGKTEISLNLAKHMRNEGKTPHIIDLDIINPYFRSRELKKKFANSGIRIISPQDEYHHSDLPIIVPETRRIFEAKDKDVIIDLGGDEAGVRVLNSLRDSLNIDECDFLFVLNKSRPFTSTIERALNTIDRLEAIAEMKIKNLISNTHLCDETAIELILSGYNFAKELSCKKQISISLVAILDMFRNDTKLNNIKEPILWLNRGLLKPWETNP